MSGMADQDHLAAAGGMASRIDVNLGDQRAGCVEIEHLTARGLGGDELGNAVGRKHDGHVLWHFLEFLDEHRALAFEILDDGAIVDDLMADIDRRAVFLQRQFDDLNGTVDTSAEAARAGEEDGQRRLGHVGWLGSLRSLVNRRSLLYIRRAWRQRMPTATN